MEQGFILDLKITVSEMVKISDLHHGKNNNGCYKKHKKFCGEWFRFLKVKSQELVEPIAQVYEAQMDRRQKKWSIWGDTYEFIGFIVLWVTGKSLTRLLSAMFLKGCSEPENVFERGRDFSPCGVVCFPLCWLVLPGESNVSISSLLLYSVLFHSLKRGEGRPSGLSSFSAHSSLTTKLSMWFKLEVMTASAQNVWCKNVHLQ